jgi:calcineurin-like phosphoesterase family protein
MKTFFTADSHFGHYNPNTGSGVIKNCNRPFQSIEDHDYYLIKRWNETVGENDLVYILGDVAFKNHNVYLKSLNGKKILVTGSHDKMSQINNKYFEEIHKGMLVRSFNKVSYVLTHCPMLTWEKSHYGSINLHGHSHGRIEEVDWISRMDIGVDVADDYAPFSLEFITYKMSKKIPKIYSDDPDKFVSINKEKNLKILNEWKSTNV